MQSTSSAVHCVLITSTEARAALKLLFEVHYLYSNRLNARGREQPILEMKKKIGQGLGKNCIVIRLAVRQLVISV